MTPRLAVVLAALAIASCTSSPTDDPVAGDLARPDSIGTGDEASLPAVAFTVRPGPFQIAVEEVPITVTAGAEIEAADADGNGLGTATVSPGGTAVIRALPPGPARLFLVEAGIRTAEATMVEVPGDEPPTDLYRPDSLPKDYSYLQTRDGTLLSTFVSLPGPAGRGPYPTLIEYSVDDLSRPGGGDEARTILNALGYALVQVNARGTGCSGGSFDPFGPIQALDGYDVVETVAAQDWSAGIGMYGLGPAGVMQLLVAATRPPSLLAIAPLSVVDHLGSVLYPGGIFNEGFATAWTDGIQRGAEPFGQGWEQRLVNDGDDRCRDNQRLRDHNLDLAATVRASPFTDELIDSRSPSTVAADVTVPVFLAAGWQDEGLGAGGPNLIEALTSAPVVRAVLYNGLSIDALGPEVLAAMVEFYDLFVETPEPGADASTSAAISSELTDVVGGSLAIPFVTFDPAEVEAARETYRLDDPIRVLFEQGAERSNLPVPAFEATFGAWPPAELDPVTLTFGPAGDGFELGTQPPGDRETTATFTTAPAEAGQTTSRDLGRIVTDSPRWSWPAPAVPNRIVATSEELTEDLVLVGPARVDLWVSADASDADIEVTLSELAPNDTETYLQAGWLRLSRRALAEPATILAPAITGRQDDVEPLVAGGDPVLASVQIPPVAHVLRAGSRLRVTIDTPGASRPLWRFAVDPEPVAVTVHSGGATVSQVVLPAITDFELDPESERPRCGRLRGQPCRSG